MTADALDLEAIEARANAATEGPWEVERWEDFGGTPSFSIPDVERFRDLRNSVDFGVDKDTATFVAHARTDIPALVAALRAAETKLAAIHNLAQLWTASDNVDDLHTRVTNRAYAGVLLDVLHREGALDE